MINLRKGVDPVKNKRSKQVTRLACFLLSCAALFSGCSASMQDHSVEEAGYGYLMDLVE